MSEQWEGGKGDKIRPYNIERYNENFDRIFKRDKGEVRPTLNESENSGDSCVDLDSDRCDKHVSPQG